MNKIQRKVFYIDIIIYIYIYRNQTLHVDTCVWLNKYITINSCSLCIFSVAVVLCTYLNNIGSQVGTLYLYCL